MICVEQVDDVYVEVLLQPYDIMVCTVENLIKENISVQLIPDRAYIHTLTIFEFVKTSFKSSSSSRRERVSIIQSSSLVLICIKHKNPVKDR